MNGLIALRYANRLVLVSAAEHDLSDHARCDRSEDIVAANANPVVSAWRLSQAIAAVVVDHILTVAVIIGQPVSTAPFARAVATHAGTAGATVSRAVVGAGRRTVIVVVLAAGVALRTVVLRLILILIAVAVTLHTLRRLTARALLLTAVVIVTRTAGAARSALRKCR